MSQTGVEEGDFMYEKQTVKFDFDIDNDDYGLELTEMYFPQSAPLPTDCLGNALTEYDPLRNLMDMETMSTLFNTPDHPAKRQKTRTTSSSTLNEKENDYLASNAISDKSQGSVTMQKLCKKEPRSKHRDELEMKDRMAWLCQPSIDKMQINIQGKISVGEGEYIHQWTAELRAHFDDCWQLYESIENDQVELRRFYGALEDYVVVAYCELSKLNVHYLKLYDEDEIDEEYNTMIREIEIKIGGDFVEAMKADNFVFQHNETIMSIPQNDALVITLVNVDKKFVGLGYGKIFLDKLLAAFDQGFLRVFVRPIPLQYESRHYNEFPRNDMQSHMAKDFHRVNDDSAYWVKGSATVVEGGKREHNH